MSLRTLSPTFRLRSAARSHPGKRRSLNEDRILERAEDGLWVVADGMGGHRDGDVAAARLVEAIASVEHGASGYGYLTDIVAAVESVNGALFRGADAREASPSGSTLVALLIHDRHYACLWAGDSRAYLLREERLSPITHDHSLVQELVDSGELAESDRRRHPGAHVITRAVGAGPHVTLDRRFGSLADRDIFLLCSDGLTECLDDQEIERRLNAGDLTCSADLLIDAALERHAPDNISFIIISADGLR